PPANAAPRGTGSVPASAPRSAAGRLGAAAAVEEGPRPAVLARVGARQRGRGARGAGNGDVLADHADRLLRDAAGLHRLLRAAEGLTGRQVLGGRLDRIRNEAAVTDLDGEEVLIRLDLLPAEGLAEDADAREDQAVAQGRAGRDDVDRHGAVTGLGVARPVGARGAGGGAPGERGAAARPA